MQLILIILSSTILIACGRNTSYYTRDVVQVPSDVILDRGLGYLDACLALSKKSEQACNEATEKYVDDLRELSK